jgi:hypothetical protein
MCSWGDILTEQLGEDISIDQQHSLADILTGRLCWQILEASMYGYHSLSGTDGGAAVESAGGSPLRDLACAQTPIDHAMGGVSEAPARSDDDARVHRAHD